MIESPQLEMPAARRAPAAGTPLESGTDRRRVMLLLEDLGGGTGNHVCRMVAEWTTRGWDVVIVAQGTPLVRQLPAGVDLRLVKSAGWYDRFPLAQVRRLYRLWRIAREVRPDVVHSYFFWSIVYGRMLKLLGVAPVLIESREDMGFSWGRGSYRVLRATRSIPDRVVCVADAVRNVVVEKERIERSRTSVIRNGIGSTSGESRSREEARRELGFGGADIVIGMVANLPRSVKGGRRLLDAVAGIVARLPEARFLLVGVGADAASLEPELRARGIGKYVVGAGYRRDVDLCYAAMDISVLTSSTEGLSITLLESMRHGLPTVVTRVGGNAEIVIEGVTGFLVDLDDGAAFIDRVVSLGRDASLRDALGTAGRRRVEEHFAIDGVARRYLDVYDESSGRAAPGHGPHGSFRPLEINA